jgi:hypothetical protein
MRWMLGLGVIAVALSATNASAQGIYGGYVSYGAPGCGYSHGHRHHHGCGHARWGGVYGTVATYPAPYGYSYSYAAPANPAMRGFVEGERFIATGRAPHHRMSPAELQGFLQGERQAMTYRPW